jgi:hypothetical protein
VLESEADVASPLRVEFSVKICNLWLVSKVMMMEIVARVAWMGLPRVMALVDSIREQRVMNLSKVCCWLDAEFFERCNAIDW